MKRLALSMSAALVLCAAFHLSGDQVMAEELKVGDEAPAFELMGSDGKTYKSSELKDEKKVIVLAWFPKVFTGG